MQKKTKKQSFSLQRESFFWIKKLRRGLFSSKRLTVSGAWAFRQDKIKHLEKITKCGIKDPELREEALTHRSLTRARKNNERLEFLGDAVLDLVATDILMKKYPQDSEGVLTKRRSQLVSGRSLAAIAEEFGFHIVLRTGSEAHRRNPRLLAGVVEAWIGAVYKERGLRGAEKLIKTLLGKSLDDESFEEQNYKSFLQEWCQKQYNETPIYKVKKEQGLEHKKTFIVEVFIQGVSYGLGQPREQKKLAEQSAAYQALQQLKVPSKRPFGRAQGRKKNEDRPKA